jgi:hypothetical protein
VLEFITTIATLASGPEGALVITVSLLLGILYGSYKLMKDWILPQVTNWLERQDMRFEDILASHAEDRELFRDSIKLLVERIKATDDKVDSIAEDVEDLRDDFRQFIER